MVAMFHQTVAFLLFLQLDVHHWILRGIAHSFEYLSPGAVHLNRGLTAELLHGVAGVLETGLQIAAPVLAATLVADVILGFLGKASPQMPLMLLGPATQKHVGRRTTGDGHPLLAGTVSKVLHGIRGIHRTSSASGGADMSENKTEKPTPRRRQKAREQGQVARSRDLSGILAVSGAFGLVAWQGYAGIEAWRSLLRQPLSFPGGDASPTLPYWSGQVGPSSGVQCQSWQLRGLVLAGGLAQGGLVFAPEALVPKVERLSPAQKLRQIFSLTGLSGLLKSLLPFAAICYVGFATLRRSLDRDRGCLQHQFLDVQPLPAHRCSKSPGNPPWCCSPGPWWTTS